MKKQQKIYVAHSMTLFKFHLYKREDSDAIFDPTNIQGEDLFDLFDRCVSELEGIQRIKNTEKFVQLSECIFNENLPTLTKDSALLKMQCGKAGSKFTLQSTQEEANEALPDDVFDENTAAMVDTRVYLRRKSGFSYALACVESVSGYSKTDALFIVFKDFIERNLDGVELHIEPLQIQGALNKYFSGILDIELRRYMANSRVDSANVIPKADIVRHIIKHAPREKMSLSLFDGFLNDNKKIRDYLGVKEYKGREELYVSLKLKRGGAPRTYLFGGDYDLPVKEVLNKPGKQPLSDNEFIERCNERCNEVELYLDRQI